jgi:hypothetical protein
MKGTRPGTLPTPNHAEAPGRTCAAPGCATKLSIYNRSTHCWQHTDIVFPNYRGKRMSPGHSS